MDSVSTSDQSSCLDIAKIILACGSPVVLEHCDKGRVLRATEDLVKGDEVWQEDATMFSVGAIRAAYSVPGLSVFGKSWMLPLKLVGNEAAALKAVRQLHPEQKLWSDDARAEDGDSTPGLSSEQKQRQEPASVKSLWQSLHDIAPTDTGAASALASKLLSSMWREYNCFGHGPVPTSKEDSHTWPYRMTDSLTSHDDEDILTWLLLRLVAPMNAIGCECRVPARDASATHHQLRQRITDEELLDAGIESDALFGPFGSSGNDSSSRDLHCSGLFLLTSMLSHDCAPNCYFRSKWNSEQACPRISIAANRDIKAGEELTISYIGDGPMPKGERIATLQGYGFTCSCGRCSAAFDDTVVYKCDSSSCDGRVFGVYASTEMAATQVDDPEFTCCSCGKRFMNSESLDASRRRVSELLRRLDGGDAGAEGACADEDEGAIIAQLQQLLPASGLHGTDAVCIDARSTLFEHHLDAKRYAEAAETACHVADALCCVSWAGFRRRFFALLDAADACAVAGDAEKAARYFSSATECMRPYHTDTGTPLMAALLGLCAEASMRPPQTRAAALALRRRRLRLEDELEDDEY